MGEIGLKLIPMLERRLLGPLGLSGSVASVPWTHSFSYTVVFMVVSATFHPLTTLA